MRARHRLEFDLFLKRRKARLATVAAIAAAAEEAAATQQSQHYSPGQTQYYTLPPVHPGTSAPGHMMGAYGFNPTTSRTAFLPTAAALNLHMQQQQQLQQQAAAAAAVASRAAYATPEMHHQPGSSLGHGFTLPLSAATPNFHHHLQNIRNYRAPPDGNSANDRRGSSLTPSPTVSPTPVMPPLAVSPLPPGEQQHSTAAPSSTGTATAPASTSGASQLSAQSPEFGGPGSMKGGQGSTPDTPTRAPVIPHPQQAGIPPHLEAQIPGFLPAAQATYGAMFGQAGPAAPGFPNAAAAAAYHAAAAGYYFPPGYMG